MKADLKPVVLSEYSYLYLSKRLRNELELKIEELYKQDRFNYYAGNRLSVFENTGKSDWLCACLLSKTGKNQVLSGKLLSGIKTWFNMYDHDRLSVIDKFRTYYLDFVPKDNTNVKSLITIAFCKFLINELLITLAESRWQALTGHID